MPVLRSVADIRDDLGYDNVEDVNKSLASAIRTATESLASRIRDDFTRVTVVDEFYVERSLQSGKGRIVQFFKLGRGMIDSGETINVYAANSARKVNDASADSVRVDLQDVAEDGDSNYVRFDHERGQMNVSDYDLSGLYVRVEYTAGFTDDGGNPAVYESTPQWLQELCTLEVSRRLDQMNNFPRATRRTEEERQDTANIEAQLGDIILGHARYMPTAIKPEISTETEI
jgi:hypothetical protein